MVKPSYSQVGLGKSCDSVDLFNNYLLGTYVGDALDRGKDRVPAPKGLSLLKTSKTLVVNQ